MENKTEFKKELGLLNATSLVAGSMIGSGIFIVTSIMARDIGGAGWILLAWMYADEPLKLFQEEFHCACSSKARGKARK